MPSAPARLYPLRLAADLANAAQGLTGADIAYLCQRAAMFCVKDGYRTCGSPGRHPKCPFSDGGDDLQVGLAVTADSVHCSTMVALLINLIRTSSGKRPQIRAADLLRIEFRAASQCCAGVAPPETGLRFGSEVILPACSWGCPRSTCLRHQLLNSGPRSPVY